MKKRITIFLILAFCFSPKADAQTCEKYNHPVVVQVLTHDGLDQGDNPLAGVKVVAWCTDEIYKTTKGKTEYSRVLIFQPFECKGTWLVEMGKEKIFSQNRLAVWAEVIANPY